MFLDLGEVSLCRKLPMGLRIAQPPATKAICSCGGRGVLYTVTLTLNSQSYTMKEKCGLYKGPLCPRKNI